MKKGLAILIGLAIALTSLFGCTDGSGSANTLSLAWDFNVRMPVWQKVVAAYNEYRPEVRITLDQKDGQTYNSWLGNQLTSSKPDADIVINNGVTQFFASGKFVDFSQYLTRGNPYADDAVWSDLLEASAYQPYSSDNKVVSLHNESVVTAWFYNRDLFEELGVVEAMGGKEPEDWNWDDLIEACALIKEKGKIPVALGGDYSCFWAWQGGWLYRVYTDQYFRDMEEIAVAKPGDYCYDEELQSTWKFDLTDKNNDNTRNFIPNQVRVAKLVKDGEIGPSHAKYKDMVKNLSRLIPAYVPNGFTALSNTDAANKFILGEAAIYIDQLNFYAGLERTFKDNGAEPFDVGVFRYPPMTAQTEGVTVGVDYTRDPGGASGNFGIIYKNKEQADLAVDFLMYFFSPEGQSVYLSAMAEEDVAPNGVPLVKGTSIPDVWKGKYDMEFPGKADSNPLGAFSNGFMEVQESVREFVEQSQSYYNGKLTLDEYCDNLQQKACVNYINTWLRSMGYRANALDNPALNPAAN